MKVNNFEEKFTREDNKLAKDVSSTLDWEYCDGPLRIIKYHNFYKDITVDHITKLADTRFPTSVTSERSQESAGGQHESTLSQCPAAGAYVPLHAEPLAYCREPSGKKNKQKVSHFGNFS